MLEDLCLPRSWTVTVAGGGVRLAKIAGGTGPLTFRLEDNGGVLIDSFDIPAVLIADGPAPDGSGASDNYGVWVSGVFASTRVLTSGSEYRVRLSCPAGTTMWASVLRRLAATHAPTAAHRMACASVLAPCRPRASRPSWSPSTMATCAPIRATAGMRRCAHGCRSRHRCS